MNFRKLLGVELIEVSPAERLVATIGGGLSILLLMAISFWAIPGPGGVVIIASMGASAVLLFAVPHGQLSQPWPVIAGHGISAVIGVACARFIPNIPCAGACAVGLAIGAMHQCKCIHPPGGATALTAVIGGSAIHSLGLGFVLFPVLTNALAMVLLSVIINFAFPWRRYPAILNISPPRPQKINGPAVSPSHEEVREAIKTLDSFVDISEEDLLRLTEILSRKTNRPKHQIQ